MTDQLAKIAQIIQANAFNGHRIRLIGATRTAAIELRGLSDADMAELGGEHAKVAVEYPPSAPIDLEKLAADAEDESKAKRRFGFLDKGDAE